MDRRDENDFRRRDGTLVFFVKSNACPVFPRFVGVMDCRSFAEIDGVRFRPFLCLVWGRGIVLIPVGGAE